MRHSYYLDRPDWTPTSGPAREMLAERQPGDPLETIAYGYTERPAVWVFTAEGADAPSWRRAIVTAKQRHRAGWVVQVDITLPRVGGTSRLYWWGPDNVVPASPPRP